MLETKIAKIGNSLTVRLPSALARDLDLHEGDRVRLRKHASFLIIEPARREDSLEAMLATVTEPENELNTGHARGAENFD
jgi:antitoxin component of MazEF toxin-antitoxin module